MTDEKQNREHQGGQSSQQPGQQQKGQPDQKSQHDQKGQHDSERGSQHSDEKQERPNDVGNRKAS